MNDEENSFMTLDPVQHTVSSSPLKHRLHVADSDMYSARVKGNLHIRLKLSYFESSRYFKFKLWNVFARRLTDLKLCLHLNENRAKLE
jgi:hypothetical protein